MNIPYFQQVGGLDCRPVTGEITFGLERIAMSIQDCDDLFELAWSKTKENNITYGDIYHQNEVEMSRYNFDLADTEALFNWFDVPDVLGSYLWVWRLVGSACSV